MNRNIIYLYKRVYDIVCMLFCYCLYGWVRAFVNYVLCVCVHMLLTCLPLCEVVRIAKNLVCIIIFSGVFLCM